VVGIAGFKLGKMRGGEGKYWEEEVKRKRRIRGAKKM